jgi:predicted nucleic acid-binding protein
MNLLGKSCQEVLLIGVSAEAKATALTVAEVFDGYAALVVNVSPLSTPRVVKRDPDDDHVIAYPLAARADAIVSGDGHLLDPRQHQGIVIRTAG